MLLTRGGSRISTLLAIELPHSHHQLTYICTPLYAPNSSRMTCFLSTALWNTACAAVVAALVAAHVANSQVYQLPWWHPTLQAMARSHITKSDHSPVFSLINPTIQRFTRESHNGDIDCPRGYLCDGE